MSPQTTNTPPLTLQAWIDRLNEAGLLVAASGAPDTPIDRLTANSREAGPSSGFVAIRGVTTDGHLFIDKAVSNGATAIVCEAGPEGDLRSSGPASTHEPAFLRVRDARRAWVELASLIHDDPGRKLILTAITGTNGKTSIATLLHHVLHEADHPCGLIGTTGVMDGRSHHAATHTTPSPDALMSWLNTMHANGCRHVVMEASSHAIDQHRLRLADVDVALFTNLTQDHLDYHGSMEPYFLAKKGLFDALSTKAVAITNADDSRGLRIVSDTKARIVAVKNGASSSPDAVTWTLKEDSLDGLVLTIDGDTRRYRLAGAYNAFNLAAAYAAARALGRSRADTLDRLAHCPPVRGRFERLTTPEGTVILIDYAHTPDALENVLRTARQAGPDGQLWCLFGCGGDRDRGKRPRMGAIAEALADRVIVTSDNPRSEAPESILEEIRTGMHQPDRAHWIVDRKEAIETAARLMDPGDVLVVAGKGHETTQSMNGETRHFDDREEARKAFGLPVPDPHAD